MSQLVICHLLPYWFLEKSAVDITAADEQREILRLVDLGISRCRQIFSASALNVKARRGRPELALRGVADSRV